MVRNPFVHRNMCTCLYLSQCHLSLSPSSIYFFTYTHMQSGQGEQTDFRYEWRFQRSSLFISTSRHVAAFCVPLVVAVGHSMLFSIYIATKACHGIHKMPNLIRIQGKKSCSTTFEPNIAEVKLPKIGY